MALPKTPEQLEWEKQLGGARKRTMGNALRIVIAMLVASAVTGGLFATMLGDAQEREDAKAARAERRHKAEDELRSMGVRNPDLRTSDERIENAIEHSRFGRRQSMRAGILGAVVPFVVGTFAFVGVFLLLGGRLSEEHKRGLKGMLGFRSD